MDITGPGHGSHGHLTAHIHRVSARNPMIPGQYTWAFIWTAYSQGQYTTWADGHGRAWTKREARAAAEAWMAAHPIKPTPADVDA